MPKRDSVGYISITNEGNVSFSFKDFYIEIVASKQLKTINAVKDFDKSNGYIVLATNYGEEYYCLEETIEAMGLSDQINVREKMSGINSFVIV